MCEGHNRRGEEREGMRKTGRGGGGGEKGEGCGAVSLTLWKQEHYHSERRRRSLHPLLMRGARTTKTEASNTVSAAPPTTPPPPPPAPPLLLQLHLLLHLLLLLLLLQQLGETFICPWGRLLPWCNWLFKSTVKMKTTGLIMWPGCDTSRCSSSKIQDQMYFYETEENRQILCRFFPGKIMYLINNSL